MKSLITAFLKSKKMLWIEDLILRLSQELNSDLFYI